MVADTPLHVVGLNLGLRLGELAGIEWPDINIDHTTEPPPGIRHHVVSVPYKPQAGTSKADASIRTLELDPPVVAALRALHTREIVRRVGLDAPIERPHQLHQAAEFSQSSPPPDRWSWGSNLVDSPLRRAASAITTQNRADLSRTWLLDRNSRARENML